MDKLVKCLLLICITVSAESLAMNNKLITEFGYQKSEEPADTLVVMLHGYVRNADSLKSLVGTINSIKSQSQIDYLVPELPLSRFSTASPNQIVSEVVCKIDSLWAERKYEDLLLVGHSVGGLLARKIYIAASGEIRKEAKFEESLIDSLRKTCGFSTSKKRAWTDRISKLILFAGMNNGWTISHHMSIPRAIAMKLGVAYGYVQKFFTGRTPFIFHARNGSAFITQIRLQWLALGKYANDENNEGRLSRLLTYQLLGTVDDLVAPDDNLDLVTGKKFTYIEVPNSDHGNIIDMDEADFGSVRAESVKSVFDGLDSDAKIVDYSNRIKIARTDVKDVVFVIHGIRDLGHWTQKIANRVRLQSLKANEEIVVEAETSSYGYFPMLSFLNPGARQAKVNWLMNRYVEAKAMYPNADFHYVGHSHGTYLLTRALQDYESVKFKRVLFAGSVVRSDFKWQKHVPDQVESVINFVSTADWVVAFFPKALQTVGVQDLGSAGHDGFDEARNIENVESTNLFSPETYIKGGHSSALQEEMWDAIGSYIITGEFVLPESVEHADDQAQWVSLPARIAPFLWLVGIVAIVGLLVLLLKMDVREWKKTCLVLAYLAGIWWVITSV